MERERERQTEKDKYFIDLILGSPHQELFSSIVINNICPLGFFFF